MYRYCFRVEHEYNSTTTSRICLHNELLLRVMRHARTRNLFFISMALELAILWTSFSTRAAFFVWLPLSAAMLVSESLIEPRYASLPIALFMLLRKLALRRGRRRCMHRPAELHAGVDDGRAGLQL